MKKPILILFIFSIFFACSKDDDTDGSQLSPPDVESRFYYKEFSPVQKYFSYDTLLNYSCGPTPSPSTGTRVYPMDIDINFQADFFLTLKHSKTPTSGCDYYNYEVIIEGTSDDYLIATDNGVAIKFEADSLISSAVWEKTAIIHQNKLSPHISHTFNGKKFIGISMVKDGVTHYGYIQAEFPNMNLFITNYAINFLNPNLIIAGQVE
jgi:hypothetical protein